MNSNNKPGLTDLCQQAKNQQLINLVDELNHYQLELEIQNDQLQHVQMELAIARQKYSDLVQLVPVGYLIITDTEKESIVEVNQIAADLLQMDKNAIVNLPLTHFIFPADQDIYNYHCQKLSQTQLSQTCEIRLKRDNTFFYAKFKLQTVLLNKRDEKGIYYLTTISDIAAPKKAEFVNKLFETQVPERTNPLETMNKQLQEHSEGTVVLEWDYF